MNNGEGISEQLKAFRKEQLHNFTDQCGVFANRLSQLFDGKGVNTEVMEWTEPDMPNFYYLHVDFDIPNTLGLLSITWDPKKKVLDRNVIRIDEDLQGQGYGKAINRLAEELVRDLDGDIFRISSITNEEWKQSLLKQGFTEDDHDDEAVYKEV